MSYDQPLQLHRATSHFSCFPCTLHFHFLYYIINISLSPSLYPSFSASLFPCLIPFISRSSLLPSTLLRPCISFTIVIKRLMKYLKLIQTESPFKNIEEQFYVVVVFYFSTFTLIFALTICLSPLKWWPLQVVATPCKKLQTLFISYNYFIYEFYQFLFTRVWDSTTHAHSQSLATVFRALSKDQNK